MNIPVNKLIEIINSLPKPYEANQFIIVPVMPPMTIHRTFKPNRYMKGGKNETELHFRSARCYEAPGFIWTLEI